MVQRSVPASIRFGFQCCFMTIDEPDGEHSSSDCADDNNDAAGLLKPIDRPPFELSTHGGHLRKLTETTTVQPPELTQWLRTMTSPVLLPRRR